MDILDSKTDQELISSILAEIAKAHNELKCAKADIDKAQGRMKFAILLSHKLIERQGD